MSTLITWMAAILMSTDGQMVLEASASGDRQALRQGLARVKHVELEHCDASHVRHVLQIDGDYDPVDGITIEDVPVGSWCAVKFVFHSHPSFTTVDEEFILTDNMSVLTVDTGLNPFGIIINKGVMSGNPG